jgi:hypothetical protein
METEKAIEILRSHNEWRRDNLGKYEMQDPKELGEAIDQILMVMACFSEPQKVTYHLLDDGGANTITLPILIPEGVTFKHEYGHYVVSEIVNNEGDFIVMCEKFSNNGI